MTDEQIKHKHIAIMKATDLMIGDWVMIKDYPMKAMSKQMSPEYYTRSLIEIEPITLTKEILLKNGFKDFYGGGCIIKELSDDEMPTLYVWDGNDSLYVVNNYSTNKYTYIKGCKYVHEFQHELKSCGIEKEIVL